MSFVQDSIGVARKEAERAVEVLRFTDNVGGLSNHALDELLAAAARHLKSTSKFIDDARKALKEEGK